MLWFVLALLTAISVAIRDVSVKAFADLEPLEIAAMEMFWGIPLFAAGFLLVPVPELDRAFWEAFLLSIPLNMVAYILYLYAIKLSPISLSVPFLAFTPVFMILTGFITLGETVTLWGGLGTGLIVIGGYVLNFSKAEEGILKPVAALVYEKGSWLMLIVAFLFAFAAVIGKKAILHSSPLFFSYFFFMIFNLITLACVLLTRQANWRCIMHNKGKGLWLGTLLLSHISFHGLAIAISTAVYMIAVKRSSILFCVLLSWIILKEGEIKSRGLGTLLMFGGVLLITLLG